MITIVSVKFRTAPKPYYFDPGEEVFHVGEFVIVETIRGLEFGEVVSGNKEVPESEIVGELKPVIRKATEEDKNRHEENQASRKGIMEKAIEKVEECKLDMKVVDAECTFDRKKTIIYYLAPNRVDFRELVRKLAAVISGRIEMRQIYERDDIILKGSYGVCGQPCCCTTFLPEYAKSSIKMAKNQNISLNPSSINGFCNRPMCCLRFEDDFYREELKKMPKVRARVETPEGDTGVVTSLDVIKQKVVVKVTNEEGTTIRSYEVSELPGYENIEDDIDNYDEEIALEQELPETKRTDKSTQISRDDGYNRKKDTKQDNRQGSDKQQRSNPNTQRGKGKRRPNQQDQKNRQSQNKRPHTNPKKD